VCVGGGGGRTWPAAVAIALPCGGACCCRAQVARLDEPVPHNAVLPVGRERRRCGTLRRPPGLPPPPQSFLFLFGPRVLLSYQPARRWCLLVAPYVAVASVWRAVR
jgi:hypothetical protein